MRWAYGNARTWTSLSRSDGAPSEAAVGAEGAGLGRLGAGGAITAGRGVARCDCSNGMSCHCSTLLPAPEVTFPRRSGNGTCFNGPTQRSQAPRPYPSVHLAYLVISSLACCGLISK